MSQLIETYDCTLKAIDEGKSSCIVLCDLSKAFDRVKHKGLLFKLQTYSVIGHLFEWLQSYRENRKQCVMYRTSVEFIT